MENAAKAEATPIELNGRHGENDAVPLEEGGAWLRAERRYDEFRERAPWRWLPVRVRLWCYRWVVRWRPGKDGA